jgi:hypothetical protein
MTCTNTWRALGGKDEQSVRHEKREKLKAHASGPGLKKLSLELQYIFYIPRINFLHPQLDPARLYRELGVHHDSH